MQSHRMSADSRESTNALLQSANTDARNSITNRFIDERLATLSLKSQLPHEVSSPHQAQRPHQARTQ
jgi:hypothetical protein